MAGSFVATTDRIRDETPASIRIFNRSVSRDLEALVNKAMAKDAGQRYSSAQELLEALREVHGGLTASGLARAVPQRREADPQSKKWLWAAGWPPLLLLSRSPVRPSTGSHGRIRGLILARSSAPVQLAVLPFAPTADDPSSKAFCNGLTETLTAKLTQLTGNYPLQVVPTSEIRAEGVTSVEQARKNFGVGLVLEGSLHSSGNQVRVTYTLVDAKTNRQLHADTVDADVSDAFAVEDRWSTAPCACSGLPSRATTAWCWPRTEPAIPRLRSVPARPRISARLSQTRKHRQRHFRFQPRSDPRSKICPGLRRPGQSLLAGVPGRAREAASGWRRPRAACDQAVASSPNLADGYACLGSVYRTPGEYEKAVAQFQKATALDPDQR